MLNYPILELKPTTKRKINNDKEDAYDLLAPVINRDNKIYNFRSVIVSADYVARPDLISMAVYNDDRFGDIICKVNGISNPFELNEDMVLVCPTYEEIEKMFSNVAASSDIINYDESAGTQITQNTSKIDSSKITIAKEYSSSQKLKSDRRNSTEQTVGDNNFIIDKSLGIVIY